MLVVPTIANTKTTTRTTTTRGVNAIINHNKGRNNVMQHSPVVVFMSMQHSWQQVPMLNNLKCMRMRMRGWHHCINYNKYLLAKTITGNTTPNKTLLKRSKGLRKKRDIINRRSICCRGFRFWATLREINSTQKYRKIVASELASHTRRHRNER